MENIRDYVLDLVTSPPIEKDLRFISNPAPHTEAHLGQIIKERDDLLRWSLEVLEELERAEQACGELVDRNFKIERALHKIKEDYGIALRGLLKLEDELNEAKEEIRRLKSLRG